MKVQSETATAEDVKKGAPNALSVQKQKVASPPISHSVVNGHLTADDFDDDSFFGADNELLELMTKS